MRRLLLGFAFVCFSAVDLGAHGEWVTLANCKLIENASNDGDSFHVRANRKHYIFRLYFVDAPETDQEFPDRVAEQAQYFKTTAARVLEVGEAAKSFVAEKLAVPFTVRTCEQNAMGRSNRPRFYAFIQTREGDLGEMLIRNGLARVHGASATPIGLPDARAEWGNLQGLEREARREGVGGWGVNVGHLYARTQHEFDTGDRWDAIFHPRRVAQASTPVLRPTLLSPAGSTSTAPPASSPGGPIKLDINSATEQQLDGIPGIGPVLRSRIIAARPFKSANDLKKVKGIGAGRYARIRHYFQ
jgi:endonuclease YncB( thermonuclease family)